jgi:hypothetical protein
MRQAELKLVQKRTVDRTPEPVVPDLVETLRQHVLQKAANELQCRQGHGLPAVMAGVLVAETDLAILLFVVNTMGSYGQHESGR